MTVINPAVFASHLFLRPSYGHYYFGDYYGANYASIGFSPWFSFYSNRSGYDPFYAQQHWNHRNDRQWDSRVKADFAHRRDHVEARPPRTWTAQQGISTKSAANIDKSLVVAASLDELTKSKESPIRFQPLAKEERQQISQRGQEYRTTREERQKLEAAAVPPSTGAPIGTVKPVKVKLPRTPISSQPADLLGKDFAPPKGHDGPQLDPKIEPKPRKPRGKAETPPEPKATKREPRTEQPKEEPKKVRPMVEPKEQPKAEPRKEKPVVEPKEQPKGGPKGGGKKKPQN